MTGALARTILLTIAVWHYHRRCSIAILSSSKQIQHLTFPDNPFVLAITYSIRNLWQSTSSPIAKAYHCPSIFYRVSIYATILKILQ
jgi:hypothetical protein